MQKLISYILLFICIVFTCKSYSQQDSVLLLHWPKLIPKYDIYIGNETNLVKEEYTHFKHRFWLQSTQKVDKSDYVKMLLRVELNKKVKVKRLSECDSLINYIRNNAAYFSMLSHVDDTAKQQFGHFNKAFQQFRRDKDSPFTYHFHKSCHNDYKLQLDTLKSELLAKIDLIKRSKLERYLQFKNNPTYTLARDISELFSSFDRCSYDLKSLEIIVINNPTETLQALDQLDDTAFLVFTLQLDGFPKTVNLNKMIESVKTTDYNSSRKKKLIKSLKKAK
jgi:hypothetical protein